METMLYDVRKDAIEKLAEANQEEPALLTEAIANVMMLAYIAKSEGLLSLEEAVQSTELEYLRLLVMLMVNGIEPEVIIEFGANEYWSQAPQGIWAMVYYIYFRGCILIQEGAHCMKLESILGSLVPGKWRQSISKNYQEIFYGAFLGESATRDMFRELYEIHFTFENTELTEALSALEQKMTKLNNESMREVLKYAGSYAFIRCTYGFCWETKEKIIDILLEEYSQYDHMMVIALFKWLKVKETDIMEAVLKVNSTLDGLHESGEILYLE